MISQENDKVLRAACYSRVSTVEQATKGYSIEAQIDKLNEYCKDNRMKIVDHYIDAGISGTLSPLKRPALKRLLEDVETGKIDVIVFVKLDRWFRSVKEYYRTQEILEKHGVVWISVTEDYNTKTSSGQFAVTIFLAVAQNERDRTSERIATVFEHKRKQKQAFFGKHSTPFGYIEEKDEDGIRRLVKDEAVKDALQAFFDIAIKYENISKAAKTVNLEYGLTRARHKWHELAKKEIYTGTYRGVDEYCEPYISKEDWIKLQNRGKLKQSQNNRIYLFSGMIECPVCHRNMRGSYCSQKRKNGEVKEYFSYRCEYKTGGTCKNKKTISQNKIETWLLDNLEELIKDEIAKVEIEKAKPKKKPKTNVAALKEKLRRLDVVYMAGNKSDEEYLIEQKELKNAIDKAESEASGSDNPSNKDLSVLQKTLEADFRTIYNTLDDEDKRRFWRTLIKTICVKGNDVIDVDFN